jgi:hypothetical protein
MYREVDMFQAQDQALELRDAEIWREWVDGATQREIAQRRGCDQSTISRAISRFVASVETEDRLLFLLRAVERMERLHRVFAPIAEQEKDKGAARVVIQAQALEGRYLGLENPQRLELFQAQDQIKHEQVDVRAELAAIVAKIREEQNG